MTQAVPNFAALPILDYKKIIVDAVDRNQVTIITAETGAGKSTQVPQYLAEHGYTRVIVTQPRILAARTLCRRVREEWTLRTHEDAEQRVGYRTAHERDDTENPTILYCTDGLQLVRELTGSGTRDRQVLVLDEVHEWNENMEVLVAWAKKRCQEDPYFKVVIMSATIETGPLAAFFATDAVITVPGRTFGVAKRQGRDILSELFAQLDAPGHNILTFLPGKAEIQNISDVIATKAKEVGVPIIPLHSQLEADMQQKAFTRYPKGKIILATNIAQTSVTIDDIDVVLDSGLERRSEVRSGVEGLFIAQISQADSLQRAGRAGRTKPGEYILASYDTMPCLPFDERPAYPTPEIMRKHIDRLTLRLATVGIDIETLDFYHDPSKKAIQRAKHTLRTLGAMTAGGEVTDIGRAMERFPVESSYARMLIEGEHYDTQVQSKLATIIGIQEVGGIIKGGTKYTGWRTYTRQTKSDLLAQYDVYRAVPDMIEDEREELGIITKNVTKATEVIERLHHDLGLPSPTLDPLSSEDEPSLLRCIVAGQIAQLWALGSNGQLEHLFSRQERELSGSTVVRNPRLVTGTPFDLEVPTRKGSLETLHLVIGVTSVNTDWLIELAPTLFANRRNKLFYDPRIGCLASRQQIRFGKRVLEGQSTPLLENTSENHAAFIREYAVWAHDQVERQLRSLARFHARIPRVSLQQVERAVKVQAHGIVSIDQLGPAAKKSFIALSRPEAYLGDEYIRSLGTPRHGYNNDHEHKRRSWKPQHKRKYRRER